MKYAKYDANGTEMIWEVNEWHEERYIRLTEIIEIDLVDLPPEIVVPAQVAQIDAQIEQARANFGAAIGLLEDEKAKLLAITHEG